MSRGGKGRGPDDRGARQVEQAARSKEKREYYKRRIYTYRKFPGGSRAAGWCTRVWARWHQVSVTQTRNLGHLLPRVSSSMAILYRHARDAVDSPSNASCCPKARDYQQRSQRTRDQRLASVPEKVRDRDWRMGPREAADCSQLWHLRTMAVAKTRSSSCTRNWTVLERPRGVLCA